MKSLIISNINKPLSFQVQNLKNNGIYLTTNQVKWILQKQREENFPNDENFVKNISSIIITLNNNPNLQNLPICYKLCNIINIQKNLKLDKYIIFTSKFQMNILKKGTQVFIDGTFKIYPVGYYQVINWWFFARYINNIVPIFMLPTTGKNEFLYKNIFRDIKLILEDNGYDINDITDQFMLDFEKGLKNL